MPADRSGRHQALLNGLVAVLLGLAVVLATVVGLRSIGRAQTGELGQPRAPADPNVLYADELARDEVRVHECTGPDGTTVYTRQRCIGVDGREGAERALEVTTIELAPAAPER